MGVFFAEEGGGEGEVPVDVQGVIEDADATFGLGVIELIALILEHGCLAEYGKAMGKAFWHKKLQP